MQKRYMYQIASEIGFENQGLDVVTSCDVYTNLLVACTRANSVNWSDG